ncbi:MAG TPA: hypothetical protein VFG59_03085 [Anaeromyxobacter sp.]|nr:hypothetical protein [Anaeromyxobacter sp.]
MRLIARLFALATLAQALTGVVRADEERPPTPRAEAPRDDAAAPAYGPYPRAAPLPRPIGPPPAFPYRPYYRPRFWWGFGWGWYPLYPYYPPPPPAWPGYGPPPRETPPPISTRFSVYGAGRNDGYVAGGSFLLEGHQAGFDLDVSAVARDQVTGPLHGDGSDPATWATMHFTWSLLSERSYRLRLETGASMLSLPDSRFASGQAWRGKTLFGPDVGLSGQLGLVGPLAIEGHARLTPLPTRIADTFIGLALHGGPLGVSGGWRWIDVNGNDRDAPRLWFRGPEVGLSLAF